jgi:DNA (cytosine-5)-methyltransferase 1
VILGGFAGPGGWAEGARMLGLSEVGIELDEAACRTRRAAGHATIRADMVSFPAEHLAGKVTGQVHSAPCIVFSSAGSRAGIAVMTECAALIRDMFAGRKTRAAHRNAMARALRAAGWPPPRMRPARFGRTVNAKTKHKTPVRLSRAQQSTAIRKAAFSASLVAEPARFIRASRPEWVALEQVPAVLPLWKVYAAELRAMGYSVWTGVLNAASYGVPQTRERAILIASRVRRVSCPPPTHFEQPAGAGVLFGGGLPWVSMSAALGWGATGRAAPTVTAGGTATGGAEPFGHRDREALLAAQDAGQWALRVDAQEHASVRDVTAPAPALKFGHSSAECQWVLRTGNNSEQGDGRLERYERSVDEPAPTVDTGAGSKWRVRTSFGTPATGPKDTGSGSHGSHEIDPAKRPAHTVTGKTKDWVVGTHSGNGDAHDYERGTGEPSPTVTHRADRWELHTNRGQEPDGTRQTVDPSTAPAPALTAKSGGQWQVKSFRNNNNNNNACERSLDEPAGTLFFGGRSNWAAWVTERPATTVQGDPRVGRPGHKDRDKGESMFEQDSVRITVEEAAILQSFRPDYPWHGTRTKQFEQVGNAVPPLLAMHILAEATGLPVPAAGDIDQEAAS